MALLVHTADGWTNGATIAQLSGTGSGDQFRVVSAGTSCTITADTASAMHGPLGVLFTKGGTNAASLVEIRDAGGSTQISGSYYLRMTSLPGNNGNILGSQIRSVTDAQMGRFQINTTGFIGIYNSAGTAIATGTVAMSTGVYYRVEYEALTLAGTGTWSMRYYAGDSTTALDSISGSVTTTEQSDRVRFGNLGATGTQATFSMDTLRLNVGGGVPLGPFKVVAAAATASVGATAVGTAAHVAPAAARALAGAAARGTTVKVSTPTARAAAGVTPAGTARKTAPAVVRAAAGVSATSTARKVTAAAGRSAAGFTAAASFVAVIVRAVTGQSSVGLSGRGIAVKRTTAAGRSAAGLVAAGAPGKRSTVLGRTALGIAAVRTSVARVRGTLGTGARPGPTLTSKHRPSGSVTPTERKTP